VYGEAKPEIIANSLMLSFGFYAQVLPGAIKAFGSLLLKSLFRSLIMNGLSLMPHMPRFIHMQQEQWAVIKI
jgi:hypothetical protein